jgi:AcrR family transcriptional regulator
MSSTSKRDETRQLNKQRLIQATLRLVAVDGAFDGLSLRSICKEADMPPTSFYRYFASIDELGVAAASHFVADVNVQIRKVRRETDVRQAHAFLITVEKFLSHVSNNPNVYKFLITSRFSKNTELAKCIYNAIDLIIDDLEKDLIAMAKLLDVELYHPEIISKLIIVNSINAAESLVCAPSSETLSELAKKFVREHWMIFAGSISQAESRLSF